MCSKVNDMPLITVKLIWQVINRFHSLSSWRHYSWNLLFSRHLDSCSLGLVHGCHPYLPFRLPTRRPRLWLWPAPTQHCTGSCFLNPPGEKNNLHYRKTNLSSFLCRLISYFLTLIKLSFVNFYMRGHKGKNYIEILCVWKLPESVLMFGWYWGHILCSQNDPSEFWRTHFWFPILYVQLVFILEARGFVTSCFGLGPSYSNSLC